MFSRRARLPRAAFSAHAQRLSSPLFSLAIPQGVRGYAVVVPKKTARLAVMRHRIKRRVLGVLRHLVLPQALIIYPKASVRTASPEELRKDLAALLSKAGRKS